MKTKVGIYTASLMGVSALAGSVVTGLWMSVTNPDDFAPYHPDGDDCIAAAMTETFSLSPEKAITKKPDGSLRGVFTSAPFTAETNVQRAADGSVSLLSLSMTYNNTPTGTVVSAYQIDFSSGHGWVGRNRGADPGRDDAALNLLLLMNGSLNRCAYDMK